MFTSFQRVVASLIIVAMVFAPVRVYALPEDGTIVGGTGTINAPDAGNLTINQTSEKLAIDWNSFSIGATESVHFNQDSASWLVLNRVTGGFESQILGRMSALGKIFIVNPNGVLFGAGATVDASGLVASTLNIDPANFMSGVYSFSGTGGSLVNNASLSLPGGYVALLGSNVVNNGTIIANLGTIALASGDAVTLELDAAGIISVVVDTGTDKETVAAGINNTGTLTANGGTVLLTAKNLGEILNSINNSGVIEAGALESANGYVELTGNRDITSTGTISSSKYTSITSTDGDVAINGGSVSATRVGSGLAELKIRGKNVTLDTAKVSASSTGGEDNWVKVGIVGTNSVNILDESIILAQVSGSTMDGVQVFIQGKDITIDNSDVTSESTGNSPVHAEVFLGQDPWWEHTEIIPTENISILNGSTVEARVENGNEGSVAAVEMDLTGTLFMEDSDVSAISGVSDSAGSTNAHIDVNVFGEGVGGVDLSDSSLTAQVNGDGNVLVKVSNSKNDISLADGSAISALVDGVGEASVVLYAAAGGIDINGSVVLAENSGGSASVSLDALRYYEEVYNEDTEETTFVLTGGNVSITDGSNVAAVAHNTNEDGEEYGSADVRINYNASFSGRGDVTVDNSDVQALVDDAGEAYVYIGDSDWNADVDILNGSNILASIAYNYPEDDTAALYIYGKNITVDSSTVQALSTDSEQSGTAKVALSANDNNGGQLTINNSTVKADVAGNGSSNIHLYSSGLNKETGSYEGTIDVLGGSSLLSSVGFGSAETLIDADDINVVDSTLKSLVRDDADGGSASLYLYPYYPIENNNSAITIDNSVLEASTVGRGTAYIDLEGSNNYNFYGNGNIDIINDSSILASVGGGEARIWAWADDILVADSTLKALSTTGLEAADSARIYLHAAVNDVSYFESNLTLDNASITSEVDGLGEAYMELLSLRNNYDDIDGNSILNISDSSLLSTVRDGRADIYVESLDNIDLVNSDISAVNDETDGDEVYLYAQSGSINSDADSLISADWVNLNARDNIGTGDSPVFTDTRNLVADSFETGNIFVNNIGADLLNLGSTGHDDADGEVVRANNGVVSVTTQGDMVVHKVISELGGVFLETQQGSIYAGGDPVFIESDGLPGESEFDLDPQVIAGGESYLSAPNGTIGVGTPEDKDPAISGQIFGIVSPGVTAVTGVNPAPALDLTNGEPNGIVYYGDLNKSEDGFQSIWPTAGSASGAFNPLRVDVQLVPGAPSALPASYVPNGPAGLTLRLGKANPTEPTNPANPTTQASDPALLVNPLFKDNRAYYEALNGSRVFSFEPITPTGFYAYHPLSDLDTSAFDGIALETGAYEFIDGNLNYNGDMGSYYEEGKKK